MSNQPQPPNQYPVGSIVNGHVWTGTDWVPVQVVPPPPQPAAPVQFKQPLSAKFQEQPAAVKVGVIAASLVVFLIVILVYGLLRG